MLGRASQCEIWAISAVLKPVDFLADAVFLLSPSFGTTGWKGTADSSKCFIKPSSVVPFSSITSNTLRPAPQQILWLLYSFWLATTHVAINQCSLMQIRSTFHSSSWKWHYFNAPQQVALLKNAFCTRLLLPPPSRFRKTELQNDCGGHRRSEGIIK